jgi:hypothetical protein
MYGSRPFALSSSWAAVNKRDTKAPTVSARFTYALTIVTFVYKTIIAPVANTGNIFEHEGDRQTREEIRKGLVIGDH